VVAAVVFNLVVLGINWGVAHEASRGHNTGQNDVAKYYDDLPG